MHGPFGKFAKVMTVIDIGKKIHKLATEGADPATIVQLTGNAASLVPGPVGMVASSFNAGYAVGTFINNKLGLSSKIADALVDKSEIWSSRTLVHEYVQKHGSAAEQATYKQYRANYKAQAAAAAQAGQPVPLFQPPDLPVLKRLDPAALRMASTNKDINSFAYNLALANKTNSMPPFVRDKLLK
jgi:hypothetical protein